MLHVAYTAGSLQPATLYKNDSYIAIARNSVSCSTLWNTAADPVWSVLITWRPCCSAELYDTLYIAYTVRNIRSAAAPTQNVLIYSLKLTAYQVVLTARSKQVITVYRCCPVERDACSRQSGSSCQPAINLASWPLTSRSSLQYWSTKSLDRIRDRSGWQVAIFDRGIPTGLAFISV